MKREEHQELIIEHCQNIRQIYAESTLDKRIVFYDIEAGQLLTILYEGFNATLSSPKSRKILKKEYKKAKKHDRILVVVSDSKHRTLKTHTVNRDPKQKFYMSEQIRIY